MFATIDLASLSLGLRVKGRQFLLFIAVLFFSSLVKAEITLEESRQAAEVIGKWFSKATGHYDFLSATPVATKRAGKKFMITIAPDMQTASDYGVSYMQVPRDDKVTAAYEKLGIDTSGMAKSLGLSRLHINLGFENKHDFTFSYLATFDKKFSGWGLGYKRVLYQLGIFYFSYRIQYARSERDDYYFHEGMTNDFSASLYMRLIDVFAGVRHSVGKVKFKSTIPELQLPDVKFVSPINELEYFYGIGIATTKNTRLTLQGTKLGNEVAVAAKLSFHFDSLLPSGEGWLADPRYIKQ